MHFGALSTITQVIDCYRLSGNSIGPEGAVAIAPSLEILSNLQELV